MGTEVREPLFAYSLVLHCPALPSSFAFLSIPLPFSSLAFISIPKPQLPDPCLPPMMSAATWTGECVNDVDEIVTVAKVRLKVTERIPEALGF